MVAVEIAIARAGTDIGYDFVVKLGHKPEYGILRTGARHFLAHLARGRHRRVKRVVASFEFPDLEYQDDRIESCNIFGLFFDDSLPVHSVPAPLLSCVSSRSIYRRDSLYPA